MFLMRSLSIVISLVYLLSGCDLASTAAEYTNFVASNQQKEMLDFKIDGMPYHVKSMETCKIQLNTGIHFLGLSSGERVCFLIYPDNRGGIINPDRQMYYAYSFIFGPETTKLWLNLPINKIIINGISVTGPIISSNAYIIDNKVFKCHYGIGESIPTWRAKQETVSQVLTKCFTKAEFIEFLASEHPLKSGLTVSIMENTDKNHQKQKDSVTSSLSYSIPKANFSDENLQEQANIIIQLIREYKLTLNVSLKQQYIKQYVHYVEKMATRYNELAKKQQDNEQYIEFMNKTAAIFNAGILIGANTF